MMTPTTILKFWWQGQNPFTAGKSCMRRSSIAGNRMRLYAFCGMCVAICLMISPLSAQVKSSAITGIVTDPSGAVVQNASVAVLNEETSVSVETRTSDKGEYTVPYLSIGHYTLSVQTTGFETYRKTGIVLDSATTLREDVSLVLGQTNATITVRADALALQTESPTVQGVVSGDLIQTLPNINNNPLYWSTLQAGVVPDTNMLTSTYLGVGFTDRQAMSEFRINGTELGSNDIQLNGLSIQGAAWHETAVVPNPDSLQEETITTSTFTADMGDASGVISMTTKSGTNDLHGDLNYMIRNEDFNANGFYNNYYDIPRPKYRLLQGGGSIGGPVIVPKVYNGKGKLFFFASYLRLTHSSPDTFLGKVPTGPNSVSGYMGERNGDFSETMVPNESGVPVNVNIYNPFTATPASGSTTTFQRQIYPGAIVTNPNQYGVTILNAYPLPNHTPSDAYNDNNYFFQGTIPEVRNSINTRADYKLGQKQSLYFTFGIAQGSISQPNAWGSKSVFENMPVWPGVTTDRNPYAAIGDTITLNPTTVIDLRYGVTHIHTQSRVPPATGIEGSAYGVPSAVGALDILAGDTPSVGNFNTNDSANQGNYTQLGDPEWDNKLEAQLNHAVSGSITKVIGNWTLKEGAEYRVDLGNWTDLVWPTPAIGVQDGAFSMPSGSGEYGSANGYNSSLITNPADQGYSLASAVTGVSGWALIGGSGVQVALAAKYLAFYTQDSWRATRKLNLTLGLRYEVQPGPTDRHNRMSSMDLSVANPYSSGASLTNPLGGLGLLTFPGVAGYSRNLYNTEYGNVSPRVGATYQLNKSTVIRGGYGRNYMPSNTGFNANGTIYGTEPFSATAYPIPYGLSPNGSPAGTFDQTQNTLIVPPAGAHQSPSLYGIPGGGVDVFNRHLYKTGVTDQWNVAVERTFGREWLVSAAYVGSRSQNLPWRGYSLNGVWNVPSGTLQSWRSAWLASSGTFDPSQVQVPNPLPALIGQAAGPIGNSTITAMEAQEDYLPWLGQTDLRSAGSSNYHSLVIRGQHAYAKGVTLMANYTWSKALGRTGGLWNESYMESQAGGTTPQYGGIDYSNLQNNYSLLGFDTPNRFVAAVSYLLPTGKGKALDPVNPVARAIIGEWQVSSAITMQGGNPWGSDCSATVNGRCNVVKDEAVQVPKSLQHWYDGNTSVTLPDGRTITPPQGSFLKWNLDRWTQPWVTFPNGTYGNDQYTNGASAMTEGDLRMPGVKNVNISVIRKFDFGERAKLELHADATNAFNRVNFSGQNYNNGVWSVLSTGQGAAIGQNADTGFGTLSQSFLEPRQLTLALQLNF